MFGAGGGSLATSSRGTHSGLHSFCFFLRSGAPSSAAAGVSCPIQRCRAAPKCNDLTAPQAVLGT